MRASTTDSIALSAASNSASVVSGEEYRALREPGVVMVFAAGAPYCCAVPLGATPRELGRGQGILNDHPDAKMSRQHAHLSYVEGRFEIRDLGSRNGSAIDGVPLHGTAMADEGALVRLGSSLFSCCSDLRPFQRFGVTASAQRVCGPALRSVLSTIAQTAASSRILFIYGESGAGKESLAQSFHQASAQRSGPFLAVNCSAIPEGIAERLLFGALKGAFSGVVQDSPGYIEAANGGTLFLDEIAELSAVVQGKLLRVIESGEVMPLGATRPRKVQFNICTATHCDLRALVQQGKFRQDLYYRLGIPQVTLPPLRQRREEIPWYIVDAVRSVAPELKVDVSLVETCMLRIWPGNIRELLAEVRTAAFRARAADRHAVMAEDLNPSAGADMQPVAPPVPGPRAATLDTNLHPVSELSSTTSPVAELPESQFSRAQLLLALFEAQGNISAAARALGTHRTQFRRLLTQHRIDIDRLRDISQL